MPTTSTCLVATLAGALVVTCASGASLPASGSTSSSPPKSHQYAPKDSPMQSDAMHDALGVAMQPFRFAAKHPEASEADKQAEANDIMSRLFERELNEGAPEERSHTQQPAAQDDDGG